MRLARGVVAAVVGMAGTAGGAAGAAAPGAGAVPPELLTRAETSEFRATSSYDETIAFIRRLEPRMPELRLIFYGTSEQGRPLPLIVVSKERLFTAKRARAVGRPVVLIVNGIHAGEIDGKDASLMMLRDAALGRHPDLLDQAVLLVLPIYNVDGHERVSPHHRPSQKGPVEGMGARTTARGLDLNRDHLKLDSEEARSLMALFNAWRPHLIVDNHVSDGFDHGWVLGYAHMEAPQAPPSLDAWLRAHLPPVLEETRRRGHPAGPYGDLVDHADPARGMETLAYAPRFNTGYFPLRNRPAILVETHAPKPYRDRVLANRDFMLALLAEVGRSGAALVRAVQQAEERTVALGRAAAEPSRVGLTFGLGEPEPLRIPLRELTVEASVVTGAPVVRYGAALRETEIPWRHTPRVEVSVPRPRGYLVTPGWPQIEQRLRGHGLHVQRLEAPAELEVEAIRVADPRLAPQPYQGLVRVEAKVERTAERRGFPRGTLWIPADQPDFEVAVQLLEPEAPDSLLSWGLLSSVLERKEGVEAYVLEPKARAMLEDPAIAAAWEAALREPAFARDRRARHLWWEQRTPHREETGLLPVYRVMTPVALTTRPWH